MALQTCVAKSFCSWQSVDQLCVQAWEWVSRSVWAETVINVLLKNGVCYVSAKLGPAQISWAELPLILKYTLSTRPNGCPPWTSTVIKPFRRCSDASKSSRKYKGCQFIRSKISKNIVFWQVLFSLSFVGLLAWIALIQLNWRIKLAAKPHVVPQALLDWSGQSHNTFLTHQYHKACRSIFWLIMLPTQIYCEVALHFTLNLDCVILTLRNSVVFQIVCHLKAKRIGYIII